jgi:UDPglucose 6-dehydrogenase
MRITVIGTGYVGLVTGVCFADLGNDVICVDIDERKINLLRDGISPIYEPGIDELLRKNKCRLEFTTDIKRGVEESDVIFIAVGTPPLSDGSADMSAVWDVARAIANYINGYKVIVNKSTMPVGSGNKVERLIKRYLNRELEFDVVSNPEFLREGSAIYDFMNPDRIVIGGSSERAINILKEIYAPLESPILVVDIETAELIKYASNSFLAMKISFINEISELCGKVGADVELVAKGMGLDKRIGSEFLKPGLGFGGSCFPKDTVALVRKAEELGVELRLIKDAVYVNKRQREKFIDLVHKVVGVINGEKIAVWGLSFKPNTNDIREAPSIDIIGALLKEKAYISAYDPAAIDEMKKVYPDVEYVNDPYKAVDKASALLILTDWNEFKQIDLVEVRNLMREPIVIDGRFMYSPSKMKSFGFRYEVLH